jgi:hypothetical protein
MMEFLKSPVSARLESGMKMNYQSHELNFARDSIEISTVIYNRPILKIISHSQFNLDQMNKNNEI